MAETNYSTLVGAKTVAGSIKEKVNHANIPIAQIVTDAEAWIYQRLRVREMLAHTTGTLTTSTYQSVLPALFRASKFFMFTANGTVAKSEPTKELLETVLQNWSYDGTGARTVGKPQMYAADGTTLTFEIEADQNYPWHLLNYQAAAALVGTTNETNFLTGTYPHILRATSYFQAYQWMKNEREKLYWRKVAEGEIEQANVESDFELIDTDIVMEIV